MWEERTRREELDLGILGMRWVKITYGVCPYRRKSKLLSVFVEDFDMEVDTEKDWQKEFMADIQSDYLKETETEEERLDDLYFKSHKEAL